MEIILTDKLIDAQDAHQIGLAHKIVPRAEVLPEAMKKAKEMASKGTIALRCVKEAICKRMNLNLEQ